MSMEYPHLQAASPEVFRLVKAEAQRQEEGIELIASENYASPAILEAMGSILTNKYSEGYSGNRYYGGNQVVDEVEDLAIDRAKQLFGAEHVNVQPLSGGPANLIVYMSLLDPGDKVLGFSLDQGGHLSHGHPMNFSGRLFSMIPYEVDQQTELIDMDQVEEIAIREKPKMIIAGFSAYSRDLDWARFKDIADQVGAYSFADIAHIAGLIAGEQIDSPVPYFDVVSTTTHKTLRGPRGGMIMCKEEFAKQIDRTVFPGVQGGPHDHITAAKAVAFEEALRPDFKDYAAQVIRNAQALAGELQDLDYRVVSDGTDNHLVLLDVFGSKGITGKAAEKVLEDVNISVNKNMIPFDPRSPRDPSGIRVGTPALTTRGAKEEDMKTVANLLNDTLTNIERPEVLEQIAAEVKEFALAFPVPGIE